MTDYVYLDDEEILKDNILDSKCKIVHLKRRTQGYFIHIVCCQFSDEQSLEKNWEELINNVANAIQKNLKELIEIFNIYVLFFQTVSTHIMLYLFCCLTYTKATWKGGDVVGTYYFAYCFRYGRCDLPPHLQMVGRKRLKGQPA